jgi:transcription initiation factor TFIID TATA-box-binding protein
MDIVNVVASGHLGREFDLVALTSDLSQLQFPIELEFNPENFHGLVIRFNSENFVVILYGSGSYVIMGADSKEKVGEAYGNLVDLLVKLDIEFESNSPTVSNIICKEDIRLNVNLDTLLIKLGFEIAEYEPETSPFLYYRPEEFDCLITIPSSGEVIITGITDVELAKDAVSHLLDVLNS